MPSNPRLLLFAGPNGSGKSTVTTPARLKRFRIAPERYINADDIARMLREEMPETAQEEREREAFRRARRLRSVYREQGESFAFETVFSHPSTLLDMRKCRALNFEIILFIVTTRSAEIDVARVTDRVASGGHTVPEDRIRSRYERTMTLLPRIIEESDIAYVMDNSGKDPRISVFPARGTQGETAGVLPDFLKQRLAVPLEIRKRERDEIARQFGVVSVPDEEAGEYVGRIAWRGTHYVAQQTASGIVRHDLLLFDAPPKDGEALTIRYKDNAATRQNA